MQHKGVLPRLSKPDAKALIGKDRRIGSKITACLGERVKRCMLKAECSRAPEDTEMLISYPDSQNGLLNTTGSEGNVCSARRKILSS